MTTKPETSPMTDAAIERLCERLEAVESSRKYGVTTAVTTNWHRNPEGPEAAATIRTQAERIKVLEDKVEGLDADLQSAVQVAWRRGAKEWARLNYRSLIPWLKASDNLNPTGEA